MANQPLVKDELNVRQRKLVREVAKGKSADKAGSLVGYDTSYARWLMTQPKMRAELAIEMEKAGVTDKKVAETLRDTLDATLVKKDGGKEYPDYQTRLRAAEVVLKAKKDMDSDGGKTQNTQINIVLTPDTLKSMKDCGYITDAEVVELEGEILEE